MRWVRRISASSLTRSAPASAYLDYDTDGWLDIDMVNGSTYDAMTGKTTPPHAALFHNSDDGTFTKGDENRPE